MPGTAQFPARINPNALDAAPRPPRGAQSMPERHERRQERAFKPNSLRQNVKRTPNSLHSERGITVLLGARNPAGWPNVDGLAILPLKSFP